MQGHNYVILSYIDIYDKYKILKNLPYNFACLYPMAGNQKEDDTEHVLSSISEMTSVIDYIITQRKFQIDS